MTLNEIVVNYKILGLVKLYNFGINLSWPEIIWKSYDIFYMRTFVGAGHTMVRSWKLFLGTGDSITYPRNAFFGMSNGVTHP